MIKRPEDVGDWMRDKVLDAYVRHPVATYVLALESELARVEAERDEARRMLDAVLAVDNEGCVGGVVDEEFPDEVVGKGE